MPAAELSSPPSAQLLTGLNCQNLLAITSVISDAYPRSRAFLCSNPGCSFTCTAERRGSAPPSCGRFARGSW